MFKIRFFVQIKEKKTDVHFYRKIFEENTDYALRMEFICSYFISKSHALHVYFENLGEKKTLVTVPYRNMTNLGDVNGFIYDGT